MIKYAWFSEIKFDHNCGYRHTYGIVGIDIGRGKRIISDVSSDKKTVKALVDLFNIEQLEFTHIDEAIENFLFDYEV